MFHCLRVKNPNAYWQAKRQLKIAAYTYWRTKRKKDRLTTRKREKILAKAKYVRFYNRRNDSFRTGLLPLVLAYLKRKGIKFQIADRRHKAHCNNPAKLKKFHFKEPVEHRPEQIKTVQTALSEKRGILACTVNFGKTLTAAAIIAECSEKVRAIYIVHRIGLAQQTGDMLRKLLPNRITVLGAGNKEFSGKGICVTTVQTAVHLLEESPEFRRFLEKTDVMFVDEIHVNSAAQVCKVSDECAAPMRFGLSGTVDEKNKLKMMHYQGITGPVIARVKNIDLISAGHSARPEIQFWEVRSVPIPRESGWGAAYLRGVVHCPERNSLIVKRTLRAVAKDLTVMISVSRISHGVILKDLLQQATEFKVEFLRGETPVSVRQTVLQRFVKGKVPILILSPIGDVGLDLPGGIGAWINAAGSKGYELVLQRFGRALRKNKYGNKVQVVDFVDLHNPYLLKHSLARIGHYQREGFEVKFHE